MHEVLEVRASRGADLGWLVWVGESEAARFEILGEALDFAAMLECSPRARLGIVRASN
ncbi:MAG: hypothetical protein ACRDJV_05370 [Actinomycetota bacterium]